MIDLLVIPGKVVVLDGCNIGMLLEKLAGGFLSRKHMMNIHMCVKPSTLPQRSAAVHPANHSLYSIRRPQG